MPDIYDTHPILHKLVSAAEVPEDAWANRAGFDTFYKGDGKKAYITLQTDEQVAAVAASEPFAGRSDVKLLSFKAEAMVEEADLDVKIEDGEVRAYAQTKGLPLVIPWACLYGPPKPLTLEDGKLVLPVLGSAAVAAAATRLGETAIDSDPNSSDDDGLPQFDQHTFDLDD